MKRTLVFLLTVLIAAQTIGCQGETPNNNPETSYDSSDVTSADETTGLSPNLEAEDYEEYEFTFIAPNNNGESITSFDFYAEELNGESMNDAIFERNLKIESKYNIKIHTAFMADTEYVKTFQNSIYAGDDEYDAGLFGITPTFRLGVQGLLCEVGDLQYIDPSMPWWNQNLLEPTAVDGKNYFLIGCANLVAFDSIGVLFFNKALAAENNIDDLYQTVYDGNWTFDKMLEYCLAVSRDIDGNGVYDEKDMYGLVLNSYGALTFTYGTGVRFVDPSTLKFSFSDKFLTFFGKLTQLPLNNAIMYGENFGEENRVPFMKKAFEENRVLFYNEMLNRTSMLRNMDKDFGILPMPKADENQENYSSIYHNWCSSTICVPVTASDTDRTSKIIEDLTYESMLSVYPTYIETNVKTKYLRDEDSPKMVDIIIKSVHFDIALLSGSVLTNDLRTMLTKSSTAIASTLASKTELYNEKLADLIS